MSKQLTLSAILSILAMVLFAGTSTLGHVRADQPRQSGDTAPAGQFEAEAF